jgi:hypothetical protein
MKKLAARGANDRTDEIKSDFGFFEMEKYF